jgi:hypothetical protein
MLLVFVTKQKGFIVSVTRCITSCLPSAIASHFDSKDTTLAIAALAIHATPPTPPTGHKFHLHVFGEIPSRLLVL